MCISQNVFLKMYFSKCISQNVDTWERNWWATFAHYRLSSPSLMCISQNVFLKMYFSKCIPQNVFLEMYFSKCISQNVFLKMYFSKCISQNVFLKMLTPGRGAGGLLLPIIISVRLTHVYFSRCISQ